MNKCMNKYKKDQNMSEEDKQKLTCKSTEKINPTIC